MWEDLPEVEYPCIHVVSYIRVLPGMKDSIAIVSIACMVYFSSHTADLMSFYFREVSLGSRDRASFA